MFFGLLTHSSGVERLLNICLVWVSFNAWSVICRISLSSLLIPSVRGVRVNLNTIGADEFLCCLLLCLVASLREVLCRRSSLLVGVKYFCIPVIVCAL